MEPNPKDRNVLAGLEKAREWGADCLVAVGGGSPIDCAKAVNGCGLTGAEPAALKGTALTERLASAGPAAAGFPVIAVPTTSGTGSEVTFSSVVTDIERQEKFTIKSPAIAPRVALIDPDTTVSMPPALTAAVEAYSSRAAEPISDAAARYADFAAAMGVGPAEGAEEAALAAVREVGRLSRAVGLPGLAELGVRRDDFDALAELSERNGSNPNHPKTMTSEDYRKLLERFLG